MRSDAFSLSFWVAKLQSGRGRPLSRRPAFRDHRANRRPKEIQSPDEWRRRGLRFASPDKFLAQNRRTQCRNNNVCHGSSGCLTSHGLTESPSTPSEAPAASSIALQTVISPALSP
jgi:hypothetical protein